MKTSRGLLSHRPVLGSVALRKTTCGLPVVMCIYPHKVVGQHELVGQFRPADGLSRRAAGAGASDSPAAHITPTSRVFTLGAGGFLGGRLLVSRRTPRALGWIRIRNTHSLTRHRYNVPTEWDQEPNAIGVIDSASGRPPPPPRAKAG